jgi:hypothetical protein
MLDQTLSGKSNIQFLFTNVGDEKDDDEEEEEADEFVSLGFLTSSL